MRAICLKLGFGGPYGSKIIHMNTRTQGLSLEYHTAAIISVVHVICHYLSGNVTSGVNLFFLMSM